MYSNISLKLLILLSLIVGCNIKLEKETTNVFGVTGNKEMLKGLNIKLVPLYDKKTDSILIFQDSLKTSKINSKILSFNFHVNYKDSLFGAFSFDDVGKAG